MADNKPLPLNHVTLKGRIDSQRIYEGLYYTEITTPAPDAYTKPQAFQIRSKAQLGQNGQELTVTCRLDGYIGSFSFRNKQTGIMETGTKPHVFLEVVG